jgi:hypothetical protein
LILELFASVLRLFFGWLNGNISVLKSKFFI